MYVSAVERRELSFFRFFMLCFVICIPLTSILFMPLLEQTITCILSLLMLLPFTLMFKWRISKTAIIFAMAYFIIVKCVYLFAYDPVIVGGPDAYRYNLLVQSFDSFKSFMSYAWNDYKLMGLDTSSYTIFGFIYVSVFKLFGLSYPGFIVILNSLMVISSIYFWYSLNERDLQFEIHDEKRYLNILVLCMFFSSSFSYFSSLFLKDITCLFFGLLVTFLAVKKRYVLLLPVTFYSFLLRPYSIAYSGSYFLIVKKMYKTTLVAAIIALAVVFYKVGTTGVINTFSMVFYILFTPNPFSLENWKSLSLPVIESLLILVFLFLMLITFARKRESRGFYFICFLNIYIYSCVLTLVGYTNLMEKMLNYALFTAGDDMFRKKLVILPIIYAMMAYTVSINKRKQKSV